MPVKRNLTGRYFQACGYCVNTDGLNELVIRNDIKNQESTRKASRTNEIGVSIIIAYSRGFHYVACFVVVLITWPFCG